MKAIFEETGAESRSGNGADAGAANFEQSVQEAAKRVEKRVNDAKAAVSAKIEDGKVAAERMIKRGRYAIEDGLDETTHQIKRNPGGAVALAFLAGAAVGFLLPRNVKASKQSKTARASEALG